MNTLCQELEDHSQSNSSRNLFRSVKDLTGKSTARLAVIKDENVKILTESEEIKDRWKRYCEELYASQETDGVPDNADEDSCKDEPDILLSEVTNAIQHLKNNKSPGPDEIPAELIKYTDESGAKVISVTGFGKQRDGLLIGKIHFSLHFPKKVMSANAKTTVQLH